MKLSMTLDLSLAEGWLSPHLAALREGRALASVCDACGAASLPPRRACSCGGRATGWRELDGTARVLARATGSDGDFALVRFEGAATDSVVRADDLPADAASVRLLAARGERPALAVGPQERE